MGFWKGLKELSNWSKKNKQKKEEKAKKVNESPTEEQLKDNKKGKLSFLWTFLSVVVYVLGFGVVAKGFDINVGVGIIALLVALLTTPLAQRKAISLAQEQRRINGKGLIALILAVVLPLAILAGGVFFFAFGGYYIWM